MVADKENWASNILVRPEDEDQDVSYSQTAQEVLSSFLPSLRKKNEPGEEKSGRDADEVGKETLSQLMEVEDSNKPLDAPLAKPSLQPRP